MLSRRTVLTTALAALALPAKAEILPQSRARKTAMTAYDFAFVSIDGDALPLKAWAGRPVLVVNTASFCGFTPQYKTLEKLYLGYKDRGFVLLGVPSNDFGQQEPGSATEIKAFCSTFDVSFPLSRKEKVVGGEAHPFYRWIAAELGAGGVPQWNFHKYLIDGSGLLTGAWPSPVEPLAKELVSAIEAILPRGA